MHGNGHKGIDLAGKTSGAALGKPIPNLMDGTVIQVFKNNPSAGNGVVIKGVDGRTYRYIHMRYAPNVKNGQKVAAGYNLGQIGSTGRSTGPHLDLKILDSKGNYIDPAKVLKSMAAGATGGGTSLGSGIGKLLPGGSGTGTAYKQAPRNMLGMIGKASQTYKVNPNLIAAIIKKESTFKYNLTSGAGAKGLMQLMPGTARDMGVKNVWDAQQNINGGTKYIAQMLKTYNNNIPLALAAYNWGPGNLNKAIRKAGGSKDWGAISRYAPKETRDYVSKIMSWR